MCRLLVSVGAQLYGVPSHGESPQGVLVDGTDSGVSTLCRTDPTGVSKVPQRQDTTPPQWHLRFVAATSNAPPASVGLPQHDVRHRPARVIGTPPPHDRSGRQSKINPSSTSAHQSIARL